MQLEHLLRARAEDKKQQQQTEFPLKFFKNSPNGKIQQKKKEEARKCCLSRHKSREKKIGSSAEVQECVRFLCASGPAGPYGHALTETFFYFIFYFGNDQFVREHLVSCPLRR